jgi:hypothetical protein
MNTKRKKTKAPTEAGAKSKKLAVREGGSPKSTRTLRVQLVFVADLREIPQWRHADFPYHLA